MINLRLLWAIPSQYSLCGKYCTAEDPLPWAVWLTPTPRPITPSTARYPVFLLIICHHRKLVTVVPLTFSSRCVLTVAIVTAAHRNEILAVTGALSMACHYVGSQVVGTHSRCQLSPHCGAPKNEVGSNLYVAPSTSKVSAESNASLTL